MKKAYKLVKKPGLYFDRFGSRIEHIPEKCNLCGMITDITKWAYHEPVPATQTEVIVAKLAGEFWRRDEE